MTMLTTEEIKKLLQLQPNPQEGGYFASTYTSAVQVPVGDLPGFSPASKQRSLCGAIFYLLDATGFSALHRVTGDMIYHFYGGHRVQMLLLNPDSGTHRSETCIFGNDLARNEIPMKVIPGGTWLGSRLMPGGDYALMGVTMAPGFDPFDYTIAKRKDLFEKYPDEKDRELIIALTRL